MRLWKPPRRCSGDLGRECTMECTTSVKQTSWQENELNIPTSSFLRLRSSGSLGHSKLAMEWERTRLLPCDKRI